MMLMFKCWCTSFYREHWPRAGVRMALHRYVTPTMGMEEAIVEPPQPLVICGPSRVGKGTLIGKLMQEFPLFGGFSMSPRHVNQGERSEMVQEVHGNLYICR
jgi:hypothetical protein